MEINYVYQRLRKDFGRSAKQFTDAPTTALNETISDPDKVSDLVLRNHSVKRTSLSRSFL
jgi:hypothetical protein